MNRNWSSILIQRRVEMIGLKLGYNYFHRLSPDSSMCWEWYHAVTNAVTLSHHGGKEALRSDRKCSAYNKRCGCNIRDVKQQPLSWPQFVSWCHTELAYTRYFAPGVDFSRIPWSSTLEIWTLEIKKTSLKQICFVKDRFRLPATRCS